MIILLEERMEICVGDEAYDGEKWEPVDIFYTGNVYREVHLPIRRKIETVEELLDAYKEII